MRTAGAEDPLSNLQPVRERGVECQTFQEKNGVQVLGGRDCGVRLGLGLGFRVRVRVRV